MRVPADVKSAEVLPLCSVLDIQKHPAPLISLIAKKKRIQAAAKIARWQMTSGMKILVLEDEPLIAMDLEDLLTSKGFMVVGPFFTAAAASDGLDQGKPQAALLDIHLMNETSFDLARELKRRGMPFAFMTGLVAPNLLPTDLLGSPIILKPYNEKELLAFLAAAPTG
ncbi:hypothetical protein CXZ10_00960 [Pleomorphomonas diazotrophica]|uniref:Response regulatory domain-containing protein n=2 Tax=Pleomorphomonas diazotrophica TaxID=1166257 RepID=A0A2N3LZE9_9HYPH|nr:hypothetical protein CXZ10_00960 [Pleomorphomonas diazotrophica]